MLRYLEADSGCASDDDDCLLVKQIDHCAG
jgi:hypothetical protein